MNNNLNGFIYENGAKTIVFVDDSTYIDFPDNCRLDVKLPSSETVFSVNYKHNNITTINSVSLNYSTTSVNLPDGIYSIRQSCSPNDKVYRNFIYVKLDKVNADIAKLQSTLKEYNKEEIDKIYRIDVLKEGVKAEVSLGNYTQAMEKYNLLQTFLKKNNCGL